MHKKFDNQSIEKKWQEKWKESGIYDVGERDASKEKEYVLVELPYPSGDLHIGHWHAFAVPDIYIRYGRMTGKQMMYPMGFDAFGLPAENAAIKRDINPKEWTEGNIAYMKEQLASMGASFSWDKTTATTDPDYYKWTQWMFTQFFEKDIAYRGVGKVNWCPNCNTVIANEQVLSDDTCERCGAEIEKKEMPQWMLRITDYADRLVDDLETVSWPENIKEAQRQWIGRSQGAEITFKLNSVTPTTSDVVGLDEVSVFTTRPDTLFGATYMVLAPEHALVQQHKDAITNWDAVSAYIDITKKKTDIDRMNDTKEKTGVKLEGITATNPASGEEIPVYIADYVLAGYGTGAIMAVPAHDERDFAFATKFGISIKEVVAPYVVLTGFDAPKSNDDIFEFSASSAIIKHWNEEKYYVVHFRDNLFGFVGGHIEEGESLEETVRREVTEESGYSDFKSVTYLGAQVSRGYKSRKDREETCNDHIYYVELASDTRTDIIDKETIEGSWWTKGEILSEPNFFNHAREYFSYLDRGLVFVGLGKVINSGEFDGMNSEEAKIAITEKVGGKMTNTYRLRDWSVGRQRYWGVPIPIVYDPEGVAHPIPKEHLPWTLPEDVDFRPTGVPPLAKSEELKKRTEEIFGEGWTPEVETLDTFVDSSWYFLRYIDNQNENMLASLESQEDWMPIDLYFGGAEHTTMHLLYSRFWQKALFDMGHVTESEPYKHRINRGLILGPDGNKMSKSKGNVINPDEHVKRVGGDSVKMYLAFMGPYGETANYPWDMGGIAGIRRFLERVYGLSDHIADTESEEVTKQLHKTILKLSKDIPQYKFNTSISAMMVFVNLVEKNALTQESYETFLRLLAPFAPHLTEELHEATGKETSIHLESFPVADETLAADDEVTIGVQVNGKMRGDITLLVNASEETAMEEAHKTVPKWLEGDIQKVIYIPGKILNIIVKS
jgi:leucyl-tRNA synthetase